MKDHVQGLSEGLESLDDLESPVLKSPPPFEVPPEDFTETIPVSQ